MYGEHNMAAVRKLATLGLAEITLVFDDVAQELVSLEIDNRSARTLRIELDETAVTLEFTSGETRTRNLNRGNERPLYTIQEIQRAGGELRTTFLFDHSIVG